MKNDNPEVQGHRGCRGLLPENTIPAFLKAMELGCDVLELDVVLTGDDQVLVSHEPWMSSTICLDPEGNPIPEVDERQLNIHAMTLAEIRSYDCGSLEHPRFPQQDLVGAHKPTLREVVEATDLHALQQGYSNPTFNVEIKSYPEWVGVFQPAPEVLAARVVRELDDLGIASRCIVQSFDPAVLEAVHAGRPDLTLALLVENSDGLLPNLDRLSFTPNIYSPHFSLVDATVLQQLRERDIELVVWTVNEAADITRMIELGVDGIISDYPDRVRNALDAR